MSHAQPTSCRRATAMAAAALCAALCHAPATARETRVLLTRPGAAYTYLSAPVVNDHGQVAFMANRRTGPNSYSAMNLLQWREGSGLAVLAGIGAQFSLVDGELTQNNLGDVGFVARSASTGQKGIYLTTALGAGPLGEVGAHTAYPGNVILSIGAPTLARNRSSLVFDVNVEPSGRGIDNFALIGGIASHGQVYRAQPYVSGRQPLNAPPDRDSQDMPYRLIDAHHVSMGDELLSATFSGRFGRTFDGVNYDIRVGAVFFTDANFGNLYTVGYDYQRPVAGRAQTFQNMRDVTPVLAGGRGRMDGTGLAFAADLSSRTGGVVDGRGIYRFLSAGYLDYQPLPYGTPTGTLTEVARTGTAAPGGGNHVSFDKQVFINDSLQVAYSGEVSARPRVSPALPQGRQHGAIFIDRSVVAYEGQAAPTAGGALSGAFSALKLSGFNNAGVALFSSNLLGTGAFAQGAFLGDGRELVSVVRTGDVLDARDRGGRKVASVSLSNDAVNVHGQVAYSVAFSDHSLGTYLFTPTLHWRDPGNVRGFAPPMAWDDAKHWTLGLAPADVHDVKIDPDFKISIKGPGTDRTVRSLDVGTGAGAVQLALQAGVQLTVLEGGLHVGTRGTLTGSGTVVGSLVNDGLVRPTYLAVTNTLTNHARIEGGGYVQGALANGSAGTVDVGVGEHLTVIGPTGGPSTNRAHQNLGTITVDGGALTMVGGLGNQGALHATDASLAFVGRGLLNHGSVMLDGSRVDVAGEVVNAADGRIATGAATLAVFHDHVRNAGEIDLGNSDPAQLIGGLDLTGTSRLNFVLGAAGGPGEAALTADGRIDLAGLLSVAFADGVAPHAGDDFHVFDWSGANVHGSFASFALPDLGTIGNWDTSDLLVGGWLNITTSRQAATHIAMWSGDELAAGRVAMDVAAVPEPGTWALMLGGMLAVGMLQRRRRQDT